MSHIHDVTSLSGDPNAAFNCDAPLLGGQMRRSGARRRSSFTSTPHDLGTLSGHLNSSSDEDGSIIDRGHSLRGRRKRQQVTDASLQLSRVHDDPDTMMDRRHPTRDDFHRTASDPGSPTSPDGPVMDLSSLDLSGPHWKR
ncbi:hypothetical protein ACM66B_004203 [Microbotryomycetes sp. NB124-2]